MCYDDPYGTIKLFLTERDDERIELSMARPRFAFSSISSPKRL